jgi:hypothetical protein
MAKACVFCEDGSVPMHDEHVFANWIARLYGKMPSGIAQIIDPSGVVKTYSKRVFQDKIPIVCQERCNGGWMSRLENSVAPLLGPMIKNGWTTTLSPRSQANIAFWAVKTALVLDQFYPAARLIPDSEYPAFYAAQQPLPAHMVWIGRRNTPGDNLAASLKESINELQVPADDLRLPDLIRADIAKGQRIYRVTFSVGYVALQVFGHTLPTNLQLTEGPDNFRISQRIWPSQGHMTWPPERPLEDIGGLRGWHELFGASDLPEVPPPVLPTAQPNRRARRAADRAKRRR